MSRATVDRVWQWAVVLTAAVLAVWALAAHDLRYAGYAAFFSALVLVASFLCIEAGAASVSFEAAIVFAAVILFHDPDVALIAVFAGGAAYALHQQRRLAALSRPAQLALSYYVVALLYTSAVASNARPMAKVSGYILLMIGCVMTHVAFVAMQRWLREDPAPLDYRPVVVAQAKTLLLVSPVVAIEVMLFPHYGVAGFTIAFLPVLLVAYAMRNEADAERQNAELVRRNRELSILTESSMQILSAEGDEETLRRLGGLLSKLARLKACAVVTWDAHADLAGTVYRFGECLPSDQEILRWVESAGFAESAPSQAFVFRDDQRRFPLSGGGAIQVLIGIQTPEVIYGILIFETDDSSILKTGSLNLLTLVVNQTALSLQDQLLRREMREKTLQLEERAATMSTILDVSNSLIGSFDLDAALTRIAHAIRKSLGFELVVFALLDPKREVFVRRAHAGLDAVWEEARRKHIPLAEITALFDSDFRVSSSFFVSHTALRQTDHDFFVRPRETVKDDEWHDNDMLLVPLMSAEQLIGYLSVGEPHDRRVPSLEKVQTLEVFAVQAVTALQSARQYDEIRRLTFVDSLTPAFNHRYFQEQLVKEIHRHSRTGHELALAMLDIDNFKRINDTFGHPVGDEILKALVEELMANARDSDIVSRYGGEEFAIIFPETPTQSARGAANRLREIVEEHQFHIAQLNRNLPLTVSIGVACYPRDGMTSADLISRADSALYWAKRHGKNRVAVAGEEENVGRASARPPTG